MKRKILIFSLIACTSYSNAQIINENFDSGIPATWTQWSEDGVTWEIGDSFGTDGSDVAMIDKSEVIFTGLDYNSWLQTPFIDISSLSNPTLSFDLSIIKESVYTLAGPQISLWYDTGAGWNYISSWGENTIFDDQDPDNFVDIKESGVPLQTDSILWHSITFELDDFLGADNIRFAFGGDFPLYGTDFPTATWGWVMVDNVKIDDDGSLFIVTDSETTFNVYPNPANDISYVNFKSEMTGTLTLIDLRGSIIQKISFQDASSTQLNLQSLSPGIYLIDLEYENGKREQKKIIIK